MARWPFQSAMAALAMLMVPLFGAQAQESAISVPEGRIIATATQEVLTPDQLADRLAAAKILLLGEVHDASAHHAIERWLLRALHQRRAQGGVIMEMYGADAQPRLDRLGAWVRDGGRARADTIRDRSGWNRKWDWQAYGPFVTEAMMAGIPVIAGNLPAREEARLLSEKAQKPTAGAMQTGRMAGVMQDMHGGALSPERQAAMERVQQARDQRMARMLEQSAGPIMLLAGRFHVLRGEGAPRYMSPDARRASRIVILAAEGEEVTPDDADYVWYAAR